MVAAVALCPAHNEIQRLQAEAAELRTRLSEAAARPPDVPDTGRVEALEGEKRALEARIAVLQQQGAGHGTAKGVV